MWTNSIVLAHPNRCILDNNCLWMGQEIGQNMHLPYIDQNTLIDFYTNSYNYNIFIHVVGICFMKKKIRILP